ncbi:MAG TPA: CDP-archaeol synthase [Oligoflexus sp.]|uniref:CDP-archaeol synthase n=1 Tax=Oligoflexus sp. TaxID=1971216 RepID=UPI002D6A9C3D|nr:CDP-archaeol synthase [Oligoflexus sp.]HYX38505.1 CDP-archaeol synthase [Oligoflexus sp.]
MSVFMALCFLLLFIGIGTGQTIWLKSSAWAGLKIPIDGGASWRGHRLLGDHKTLRGFVVIIPLAGLVFFAFGWSLANFGSPVMVSWKLSPLHWLAAGLLIGCGYMLGELPNSFMKRQLGIPEGQRARSPWKRRFFDVLDESDSIAGALLAGMILLPIDGIFALIIMPLGVLLHLAFNRLFIQKKTSFPALYFVIFIGLSLSLLLVWPLAVVNPGINSILIRRFTRWGLWVLGIRCEVNGSLRSGTGILLCNHSSWLDQLLLLATIPRPLVFVAHGKYFRMPLLGWVLRRQGGLPKPETLKAARDVRVGILKAIGQGKLVVIFPEATRSEDGFPLPLRSKLRFLPKGLRWQCCWLSGAHACLARSQSLWNVRPGTLRLQLMDSAACQPPFASRTLRSLWIEEWIRDNLVPLQRAAEASRFGGKSANLAMALQKRYRVPQGFVLAAEVAERMSDPLEGDFSEHLDRVLESWLTQHKSYVTFAVRSSAVGEDGATYSFAGQLDSVLHVNDAQGLKDAVRQVVASKQRAAAYESLTEHKLQGCAVLLQQQVAALFAGVGFSRMTWQDQTVFMVEYADGLGDDLVQGRITPGRARLDRNTGAIVGEELPDDRPGLSGSLFHAIYLLGMKLEQDWQKPVDFEWAIDASHVLYLLQVRPITSESRLEKCFSNANMNENYPRPVTPFLYSFASRGYQQYFFQLGRWTGVSKKHLQAVEPALRNILGIHEGRLYYDLTAVRTCLSVLPARSTLIRLWDEFLGIGTLDQPLKQNESTRLLFPLMFVLRFMGLMLIFPWLALRFQRRVQRMLVQPTLASDALRAQEQQLQAICCIRFHRWGEAALCDAAVMIYTGCVRALLNVCLPIDQRDLWQVRLLSDSASISMQQLEDLRKLQDAVQEYPALVKRLEAKAWSEAWEHIQKASRYRRLRQMCERWLDLWGTRVSGELMLTECNYRDDPSLFLQLLAVPIPVKGHNPSDVQLPSLARIARQHRGWLAACLTGVAFGLAFPARAAIRAREICRLSQSRLYGLLRSNLQKSGRLLVARNLLAAADDPFFLTVDELIGLLAENAYSPDVLQPTIDLRRQRYQAWQGRKVPERIGRRQGRPLFSRENLQTADRVVSPMSAAHQKRRAELPASTGFVRGRIRVLHSTDECHKLQSGEILVTRETDPGWTVALGRAAALIVERGGMLSHGAIVARELGIPAVIGLRDITEELQDGMEVEVDGLKGIIQWTTGET